MADRHVFEGACSNCKRKVVAHVHFGVDKLGTHIAPPPVIGSYCECGDKNAPGGLSAQAVPLTLRGDPA